MNELTLIKEDLGVSLPQADDGTVRVIGIAFIKARPSMKPSLMKCLWTDITDGAVRILSRLGFTVQRPEQGPLALQITGACSTSREQMGVVNHHLGDTICRTFGYVYPHRPQSVFRISAYMMYVHVGSPDRIRLRPTCAMWDTNEQDHVLTWAKITAALKGQGYHLQLK